MAPRGFTYIEMLIVFAIAGIAAAVAIPAMSRYIARSRVVDGILAIDDMSKTIKRYQVTKGVLPDSLADVALDGRLDPWGYPYEYLNHISKTGNGIARRDKRLAPLNSDFDLYSVGPDGVTAASLANSKSRDDIVRARDGRFVGAAEEFDP